MHKYFQIKGFVPGDHIVNSKQEDVNIKSFAPFLRVLLVTDGTVTKSLEAFFWEPVQVENIKQNIIIAAEPLLNIKIEQGQEVLQREVRLVGEDSQRIFAYAKSYVNINGLPKTIRQSLLKGEIGIGELLRECNLETYRELLDIGELKTTDFNTIFALPEAIRLVYRTYQISIQQIPVIQISEFFPEELYL